MAKTYQYAIDSIFDSAAEEWLAANLESLDAFERAADEHAESGRYLGESVTNIPQNMIEKEYAEARIRAGMDEPAV